MKTLTNGDSGREQEEVKGVEVFNRLIYDSTKHQQAAAAQHSRTAVTITLSRHISIPSSLSSSLVTISAQPLPARQLSASLFSLVRYKWQTVIYPATMQAATTEGEAEAEVVEVEEALVGEVEAEAEAEAAHSTATHLPPHTIIRSLLSPPSLLSSKPSPLTPPRSTHTMTSARGSIRLLATSSKRPNVSFSSYNDPSCNSTNYNRAPTQPRTPPHPHRLCLHCPPTSYSRRTRR